MNNVNRDFNPDFPVLCGTNREVDKYNSDGIRAINYPVVESIAYPEISNPRYTKERALAWLSHNRRAKTHLILKNTMRVLCIQNHGRLVNGDIGTIEDISSEKFNGTGLPQWVDVKFDRPGIGLRRMTPFSFEKKYFFWVGKLSEKCPLVTKISTRRRTIFYKEKNGEHKRKL